jgi:hypothetical protein
MVSGMPVMPPQIDGRFFLEKVTHALPPDTEDFPWPIRE